MIRKARRNRIHDFDPWLHCLFAVWFVGWGGWYLHQAVWIGLMMFGIAGMCAWLGVWGIRWRWKADIEWNLLHADTWADGYMTGLSVPLYGDQDKQ